jgi:N,N-dimethylformamidase
MVGRYLGGNGVNCEVTLHDGHAGVYHNGTAAQMQAAEAESRFDLKVGESEASLLGVVYTEEGVMTAAPYAVVEPDHWVFEGSGLTEPGQIFGQSSFNERIPGGASGHETDKRSPSSPPGTRLLAKGTNPLRKWTPIKDDAPVSGQSQGFGHGGGAEMVIYDTASGGGCFSAGSITWPTELLCEPTIATITRNVIKRFSGQ